MHRGFIKVWRKFKEWGWYKCSATKDVFLHLLIDCNHAPFNFMGFPIDRGSVVVGRKQLSLELGLSERSVRTALKHLKSTNEVTIKSTSKFSIVSIANYGIYQDKTTSKVTSKVTSMRPASDQQVTTIKECKNDKKIEATPFNQPSLEEVKAYVAEIHSRINPEQFINHYEGNGWIVGKVKMKNWKAVVRTWEGREFGARKHEKSPNNKLIVV